MTEAPLEVGAAIVGGLSTFLITWGSTRGKVMDLERRTLALESESQRVVDRIHALRDVYVSREHFNAIVRDIKDAQHELRDDLKKVLELLSHRAV